MDLDDDAFAVDKLIGLVPHFTESCEVQVIFFESGTSGMACLEIEVSDFVWVFVYDFVAFGVGAVVLGFGVVIDKLSCAHFEYFHGIEE